MSENEEEEQNYVASSKPISEKISEISSLIKSDVNNQNDQILFEKIENEDDSLLKVIFCF